MAPTAGVRPRRGGRSGRGRRRHIRERPLGRGRSSRRPDRAGSPGYRPRGPAGRSPNSRQGRPGGGVRRSARGSRSRWSPSRPPPGRATTPAASRLPPVERSLASLARSADGSGRLCQVQWAWTNSRTPERLAAGPRQLPPGRARRVPAIRWPDRQGCAGPESGVGWPGARPFPVRLNPPDRPSGHRAAPRRLSSCYG